MLISRSLNEIVRRSTMALPTMALRVIGIVALLAGAAMIVFSAFAAFQAESMAQHLALASEAWRLDFDAADWALRWRLACLRVGLTGTGILIGGMLLFLKRRSGFPVLAIILAASALLPWVLIPKYAFEKAGLIETLVVLALALGAAVAYLMGRRRVDV
jgi:hypothetical protein